MGLGELARQLPGAGLILGPLAWAINTQTNYALVPRVCVNHLPAIPIVAVVAVLIGLGGFALSLMAWRGYRSLPSPDRSEAGVPHKLLAGIGVMSGALFTVVIVMQGLATVFLSGCE